MPHSVDPGTTQPVKRNSRYREAYPLPPVSSTDVKIGLEPHELERPTERKNRPPKRDGGTTRSATLVFVALAGVKVRPNTTFSLIF